MSLKDEWNKKFDNKDEENKREQEKIVIYDEAKKDDYDKHVKNIKKVSEKSSIDIRASEKYKDISKTILPFWKQVLYIILISIAITFVVDYIINPTGLYSIGLSGVSQGLAYMTANLTENQDIIPIMFWSTYVVLNIPILIFAYKKFSSRFAFLTILLILANVSTSFIFGAIPGLDNRMIIIEQFTNNIDHISFGLIQVVFGFFGGILMGGLVGLSFKLGGSSGGFDPISRYLSKTKSFNIGTFNLIFSTIIIVFFLFLNDFILELDNDPNLLTIFLGPVLFGTMTYVAMTSIITNNIYPTKKTLSVVIDSKKGDLISEQLIDENWTKGLTLQEKEIKLKSKKASTYTISLVIKSQELQDLLYFIHDMDEDAYITATPIEGMYGKFIIDQKEEVETTKIKTTKPKVDKPKK